jgi:23S rRNA (guanine745-N1)-methyltransferase
MKGQDGPVLADVVDLLACPHCSAGFSLRAGSLRCATGHAFDVARQGYANLLPAGRPGQRRGDTAEMVRARAAFLGRGHFEPLSSALAAQAARALADRTGARASGASAVEQSGGVLDVGAGTGHYLARVLDAVPDRPGLALDVSRYALRRAARAHPRAGAVACDAWRTLPVRTGAAALVLNVFAPRAGAELRRVLAPGGSLLVVTPTPAHLGELVSGLGLLTVGEDKRERVAAALGPDFTAAGSEPLEYRLSLDHDDVAALAGMGPSAWHTDPARLAGRIAALPDPVEVTVSVTVDRYR